MSGGEEVRHESFERRDGKARIDTARIPDGVRRSIGAAIYKAILRDMERTDFREGLERWLAERAARAAEDGR